MVSAWQCEDAYLQSSRLEDSQQLATAYLPHITGIHQHPQMSKKPDRHSTASVSTLDRYLRSQKPATSKMAPAPSAASITAGVPAVPVLPLQRPDDHMMLPFSPPSDLSPCLPRSLTVSADIEGDLLSLEHAASPQACLPLSALCFSPEHNAGRGGMPLQHRSQ